MVVLRPAEALRPYGRSASALITGSEVLDRCEGVLGRLFLSPGFYPPFFGLLFLVCSMWRCSEASTGGAITDPAEGNRCQSNLRHRASGGIRRGEVALQWSF
jgi:hypothetical protein